MLQSNSVSAARRPDLIIRPSGDSGACVVKDPLNSSYYRFGTQEAFLLQELDGVQPTEAICKKYSERFNDTLSPEELQQFVDQARANGLLQPSGSLWWFVRRR